MGAELKKSFKYSGLAVTFGLMLAVCHPAVAAPAAEMSVAATTVETEVAAGKSSVLQLPAGYTDLMVADPKIADVLPLSDRSVYIVGKTMGTTTLTIYGPNKRLVVAANVVVSADLDGLKNRLHDIMPEERDIAVRSANQSVVLSGTVGSPAALQQALALAETYAPTKVVNMLGVQGTQQVMLSVRFVEMDRSTAKDLKLNLRSFDGATGTASTLNVKDSSAAFQIATGDSVSNNTNVLSNLMGTAALRLSGGQDALALIVEALEQKGLAKTLAEPNLVAMSGDTASFLAGGEFPIPVAQSGGGTGGVPTISIDYKQFGVALAFTPTLLKDGMINMIVNPEVSSIDPTISVDLGLIRVPGIKVRRAKTTVELRDGESFIVAGLLRDDYQSQIRQLPGLGDVPVLGALFRSNGYQHNQTELVIIVTPHLVAARRGAIMTSADQFTPPSDTERFLLGKQTADQKLSSGGVDGPHGHVLY